MSLTYSIKPNFNSWSYSKAQNLGMELEPLSHKHKSKSALTKNKPTSTPFSGNQKWQQQLSFIPQTLSSSSPSPLLLLLLPPITSPPFRFILADHPVLFHPIPAVASPRNPDRLCLLQNPTRLSSQVSLILILF